MFAISLLIVAIILSINKKRVGNTTNVFLGKTHYKIFLKVIPRTKKTLFSGFRLGQGRKPVFFFLFTSHA